MTPLAPPNVAFSHTVLSSSNLNSRRFFPEFPRIGRINLLLFIVSASTCTAAAARPRLSSGCEVLLMLASFLSVLGVLLLMKRTKISSILSTLYPRVCLVFYFYSHSEVHSALPRCLKSPNILGSSPPMDVLGSSNWGKELFVVHFLNSLLCVWVCVRVFTYEWLCMCPFC